MIILTAAHPGVCYKAQIRSSLEKGFKQLYTATSTAGEEAAAKAVVAKWFSQAAAASVRQLKDPAYIQAAIGDFNRDPKRKQVFNVWTFDSAAKDAKSDTALAKPKGKAAQTALALTGESSGPDWTRARFLLSRIKTAIRLSIAGQVLLGMELLTIKTELHFVGRGRRPEKPNDSAFKSLNRTWEQLCNSELNISPDGADNFIRCYDAAKTRVKKHGGNAKLLGLLETHPAKLSEEDEKLLAGMVDKLVDGDTQRSLLNELKLLKAHDSTGIGGDTSKAKKPAQVDAAEQLAFAFFSKVPDTVHKLGKSVGNLLTSPDYRGYLHKLPLSAAGPDEVSLESLKETLETALKGDLARMLADVVEAIDARHQSVNAA